MKDPNPWYFYIINIQEDIQEREKDKSLSEFQPWKGIGLHFFYVPIKSFFKLYCWNTGCYDFIEEYSYKGECNYWVIILDLFVKGQFMLNLKLLELWCLVSKISSLKCIIWILTKGKWITFILHIYYFSRSLFMISLYNVHIIYMYKRKDREVYRGVYILENHNFSFIHIYFWLIPVVLWNKICSP